MAARKTFLYFAYGSNLLRERLVLANPSAEYRGVGKVEGFRLVFCGYGERWKGAAASIEETDRGEVWGTVWQLDMTHQPTLDRQEGVYTPMEVTVKVAEEGCGEGPQEPATTTTCQCRTYQLRTGWSHNRPSPHYKDVIVRGARQSKLPPHYLTFLANLPHNDFQGDVQVYNDVMKLLSQNEAKE